MLDAFKQLCKEKKIDLLKGFTRLFKEINVYYSFDRNYKKPTKSEIYLDFIREKQCCEHKCYNQGEPHHVEAGGMGCKCSDLFTVPLCREHHTEYHNTRDLESLEYYRSLVPQYLDEFFNLYFIG